MASRMLFANIGWMKHYHGQTKDDQIKGGGAYVDEEGTGGEVYNFLPVGKYYYGYIPPHGNVDIGRLGADGSESVDDVQVVWTATSQKFGRVIIGWYEHATVWRHIQKLGGDHYYSARAERKNCRLLLTQPEDERVFQIPKGKTGAMGQSNIWYADKPVHAKLRTKVQGYIAGEGKPFSKAKHAPGKKPGFHAWQADVKKRLEVETRAMELAAKYYERYGFKTTFVHLQKFGWDLEAKKNGDAIRVEVKGLSGSELSVDLTPNEYWQMRKKSKSYHLCVVLNALGPTPVVRTFAYSPATKSWQDEQGALTCTEIVGARFSL